MLLENFAEAQFIELEKEVSMYCSIVKSNCTKGDVLFLKPHPGEIFTNRIKYITAKLSNYVRVVKLDNEYTTYPIELWKELVQNSTVISMAYPVLSLRYLYNIQIIQPMDKTFIETWFPQWVWPHLKNAINLYMVPFSKLCTWNCSGILWNGKL